MWQVQRGRRSLLLVRPGTGRGEHRRPRGSRSSCSRQAWAWGVPGGGGEQAPSCAMCAMGVASGLRIACRDCRGEFQDPQEDGVWGQTVAPPAPRSDTPALCTGRSGGGGSLHSAVKLQEMGVCRRPRAHHSGSPTRIEWNWAPAGQEAFK